jgi:DNA modification methylase
MIRNRLIKGDNVEVLKEMESGGVDLTVTSPPYDNLRDYKGGGDWNFEALAAELFRVTAKGGVLVWVVGDATINGSESGSSFKQALFFKNEVGFTLHDTMIYQKVGLNFTPKNKYYQTFEYMFVFSKGSPKTFNPIQVERTGHQYGSVGTAARGTKKKVEYDSTKTTRNAGNIWTIPNHSHNATKDLIAYQHPAIFPEKLARDHILSWSNEGDLVLDPFVGSGTTAKMAKKNGRDYIGIDLSQEYLDIAAARLELF